MTQNRPYIIGLTGGIASGKSNLSRALKKEGAVVIDADEISRSLTADGGKALGRIRKKFGDTVFDGETLNRKRFGDKVFADKNLLEQLNDILHPLIYEEVEREIALHQKEKALVLEVPLLHEAGWDNLCDEVWCAYSPFYRQALRLMRRDQMSVFQAIRRIRSQMPGREKCRLSDHCIYTTGTREQSAQKAVKLWHDTLRRMNNA